MPPSDGRSTIGELLDRNGVSRRAFVKYCSAMASALALPPLAGKVMAEQLRTARRPSVIYLSFQECTGCLESLTRSFAPTIESLIFNVISLDYDDTLMAAAGAQAERAREQAMKASYGEYLLVVDGSVPTGDGGVYHCAAGRSAIDILTDCAQGAAAIVCVGTCSSFGGVPFAAPNPTGARPVSDIVGHKPIINVSGCPPIPEVITGTLLQYVTTGRVPDLDEHLRPTVFFGNTIHDRCYRRPFYDRGQFAKSFDDEGARNGWCLYELGCKGPTTHNACATIKWNDGVSFPIESGHPCLGCAEPGFWDRGSFYEALSVTSIGSAREIGIAAGAGVALGTAAALLARRRQARLTREDKPSEGKPGENESRKDKPPQRSD
jgi:hydrogenase small subunit